MNTLTRTIVVFVAMNFMTAGLAPAQEIENPVLPVLSSGPAVVGPSVSASEPESAANVRQTRLLADPLSSRSGSTGKVLVIPAAEIKTEDILAITEDMSVMSRIFERNLEQARISTAPGSIFDSRYDPFLTLVGGGRGEIQGMYLQGYGVLFLMKVDFPLSPPPNVQEEEKDTRKAKEDDPVWQQMRREMYEPEKVDRRRRTDRPEEKYDAEKVESFKTTLIKSLKHAANIRSLKPDELVIITVTGSGDRATLVGQATSAKTKMIVVDSGGETRIIQDLSPGGAAALLPTVLVMRAKKSDIDDFAKGRLDLDQFRQRVQVLTCPYLGPVAGSGGFNPYRYGNTGLRSESELDF